jgi:hypothetical protein
MDRVGTCRLKSAAALAAAALMVQAPRASGEAPLPIIPGAAGFGMETPAGSGRHLDTPRTRVIKLTSSN